MFVSSLLRQSSTGCTMWIRRGTIRQAHLQNLHLGRCFRFQFVYWSGLTTATERVAGHDETDSGPEGDPAYYPFWTLNFPVVQMHCEQTLKFRGNSCWWRREPTEVVVAALWGRPFELWWAGWITRYWWRIRPLKLSMQCWERSLWRFHLDWRSTEGRYQLAKSDQTSWVGKENNVCGDWRSTWYRIPKQDKVERNGEQEKRSSMRMTHDPNKKGAE